MWRYSCGACCCRKSSAPYRDLELLVCIAVVSCIPFCHAIHSDSAVEKINGKDMKAVKLREYMKIYSPVEQISTKVLIKRNSGTEGLE